MTEIVEGAAAPDFTMETSEGPISLADFAGKALVLYFYPKDDTGGCTKEAQAFTALSDEFAKAGATVIGVSKDSLASHKKFTAKYGLNVTLASDPEGAVIEGFGAWVEKSMYGRQYMGIERSTFLIHDGSFKRIWRKVRVPGHAEEVLAALKAM